MNETLDPHKQTNIYTTMLQMLSACLMEQDITCNLEQKASLNRPKLPLPMIECQMKRYHKKQKIP